MHIRFGTDGWRAIIAEEFTFRNVRLCAQGTADLLKKKGLATRGLVVGYDNRFASEDFAAAVAVVEVVWYAKQTVRSTAHVDNREVLIA